MVHGEPRICDQVFAPASNSVGPKFFLCRTPQPRALVGPSKPWYPLPHRDSLADWSGQRRQPATPHGPSTMLSRVSRRRFLWSGSCAWHMDGLGA
jgi:hypothetical protein